MVRIPVTIGYVTNKNSSDGDPIIAPYPNLEWNTPGGDCSGITSVYRVKVMSTINKNKFYSQTKNHFKKQKKNTL